MEFIGAHISLSSKNKFTVRLQKISRIWKSNSKFTIHPFRSLHSRHLLPLSIPDYVARFSLEFAVISLGLVGLITNLTVNHAHTSASSDQSVIFSFLKNNPQMNQALLASASTTTIISRADQLVPTASAANNLLLTSSTSSDSSTIQNDVILKPNPPDTSNFYRGVTKYDVQVGDTVESVAASFGISPQTVLTENHIVEGAALKPGQELTILPTTGITYSIKDGDTMDAILNKYKVSEEDFLDANNIESFDDLDTGAVVVIPLSNVTLPSSLKAPSKFTHSDTGKVPLKTAASPVISAGNLAFLWPTLPHTITQGFSSRHTGLDISDSKQEPIYAAEAGFVEIAGYQTNGYGNTIVINHGNGFKTRYGHASALFVTAGDFVQKGQTIAKQGHTGRVRGVTGIHLHFEILINGKRVNPLQYVHP